jgi:hypothetical protein
MTFKATIDPKQLVAALLAIESINYDFIMHVDAAGLRVTVVDEPHYLAGEVLFPPEAFETFEFAGDPLSLSFHAVDIILILGGATEKSDWVHLETHEGSEDIWFWFSVGSPEIDTTRDPCAVITPREYDESIDNPAVSPIWRQEMTFHAVSPANFFRKLFSELKETIETLSDHPTYPPLSISFKLLNSKAILVAVHNSAGTSHLSRLDVWGLELVIELTLQEPTKGRYSLPHMRQMVLPERPELAGCTLVWEFGTEAPLVATYALPGGGTVRFLLAQRRFKGV